VYAANVEDVLARFADRTVEGTGKLVDLRGDGLGWELWLASIRPASDDS
jgi:hypothetical protein